MSDDKLEEIAGAFFPESAERFSRCRAAVGRAYDLGRADWDKERERADDHDSARQSEKERADYAEAKLTEAQARAQRFHETIMSELEVRKRLEAELAAARERAIHTMLEKFADEGKVAEAEDLLLLAYHSGHREGWEAGPTTDETMSRICDWLANEGLDPNLSREAKRRLRALRGEGEKP